jgi:hypothetical protein
METLSRAALERLRWALSEMQADCRLPKKKKADLVKIAEREAK